jgi:hypothetical protein
MRKMLRRIAALEKWMAEQQKQDDAIAVGAMHRLSLEEAELLLLASVAHREGRSLTEPQMAAKQAYHLAIQRGCLGAGRRSTWGFEDIPSLDGLIVRASLLRLSRAELELVRNGILAQQEGRPVSAEEAATLQIWTNEWERLCELTGFSRTIVGQTNSCDSLSVLDPARGVASGSRNEVNP